MTTTQEGSSVPPERQALRACAAIGVALVTFLLATIGFQWGGTGEDATPNVEVWRFSVLLGVIFAVPVLSGLSLLWMLTLGWNNRARPRWVLITVLFFFCAIFIPIPGVLLTMGAWAGPSPIIICSLLAELAAWAMLVSMILVFATAWKDAPQRPSALTTGPLR